jgi:hypothetical protein
VKCLEKAKKPLIRNILRLVRNSEHKAEDLPVDQHIRSVSDIPLSENNFLQYVYKPKRCPDFLWLNFIFSLDALHVSDYISSSSGATFISCTSRLVYADTSGCCVAIRYVTNRRIGIYRYVRCTAHKSCSRRWTNTVRNM